MFSTDFEGKNSITKFHENPPVGTELFHMDERKYRHDETEAVTERDVRQINIFEKSMKSNLLPLTVCGA